MPTSRALPDRQHRKVRHFQALHQAFCAPLYELPVLMYEQKNGKNLLFLLRMPKKIPTFAAVKNSILQSPFF